MAIITLTFWVFELNCNQRGHVTLDVFVWEIVGGESSSGIVMHSTQILDVSRVFTVARNPDSVAL